LSGGNEDVGMVSLHSKFEAGNSQLQRKAVKHALMSKVKVIISFNNQQLVVFLGTLNDTG
jgi:hypothetical protein